jgi:maltooligosyltrehalose trehalohydrolase
VHDGTWSTFRSRRFGAPAEDRPPEQFVVFDQDHDQVGNRAFGDRPPAGTRALSALCVLFAPFTPMIFQGEELGESTPFQYFTDHIDPEIAEATRTGRRREFARFASFSEADVPDPQDEGTFLRSKLTREGVPAIAEVFRSAIRLRHELPPGEAVIAFDEGARWLRVGRGPFTLIANFANEPREVPVDVPFTALAIATHPDATSLASGTISLPALAGAVLR